MQADRNGQGRPTVSKADGMVSDARITTLHNLLPKAVELLHVIGIPQRQGHQTDLGCGERRATALHGAA